ncbi:transcription initiation factor B [Thermoproteus tenax]|uniref:Transcription initiation factor B n=1 Tax=Thermoproteus tenax (strain ATCC 35583 / DSM 2078 / JCM 9277 / NBRC 100435 / Kra 1) TaxID=768679 RepID=G4RLA8_THETK|nr:transcription initiation factor B [Thermoproteus tenax]CCC82353.1 transcription initiation factor B [Thermoproteus tenax Kra 1]
MSVQIDIVGRCPVCGGERLALNSEYMVVCTSCGTVLGGAVASGAYATRRDDDHAPIFGSTLFDWHDIRGLVVPKYKVYEMLNRRVSSGVETEIDKLASLLSLPKACSSTAKWIVMRIRYVRDVELTAAAALFISCRIVKTYADFKFKGFDAEKLRRKIVLLQKLAKLSMPPPPPVQVIHHLVSEFKLGPEVVRDSLDILEVLSPILGRGKIAQLVAFILAARARGHKIDVRAVADASWSQPDLIVDALKTVARAVK